MGHLLGKVEEGNEFIFLADIGYDFPLIFGEIKTGRVVCAAMEDHHIALYGLRSQGLHDGFEADSE